jgi:hypothetical protein
MKTRIQLYTVPGQVFYNSTRKLVLKGADGVVFVADSQSKMLQANVESYRNLEENLKEMGLRLEETPLVMQFNKRDLPGLASIEEMNTRINRHNAPFYEAVAMTGIGVEDTLKAITKLVLNNLSSKYRLEEGSSAAAGAKETPAPPAVPQASVRPEPQAARPPERPSRVASPPEDLALEALDGGEGDAREEEVIDLVEEVPSEEPAEVEPITLDDQILEEIEDEPLPAPVRRPSLREPVSRPSLQPLPAPGPRAVTTSGSLAVEEDPIELDEPIDLDSPLDEDVPAATLPLSAGPLRPGQERDIEVPLRVDIDGRTLTIQVKLKIRLS